MKRAFIAALGALVGFGALGSPPVVRAADATTTTVVAEPSSFEYADEVKFLVRVRPVPDHGAVVLKLRDFDGDVVVYRSRDVNPETGNATFWVSMSPDLPPADYTVTASYLGSEAFDASDSDPVTVTLRASETTATLSIRPSGRYGAFVPGATIRLSVRVTDADRGRARFYDITSGTPVFLGGIKLTPTHNGTDLGGGLEVTGVTEGTHTFQVDYLGSMAALPSSDTVTQDFAWGVPVKMRLGRPVPNPVQQRHEVVFPIEIDHPRTGFEPTGTVQLIHVRSGRVEAEVPASRGRIVIDAPGRVGRHAFRAVYSGDEHYLADSSKDRALDVTEDVVEADVWALSGSFWPSPRDGVADAFHLGGYRHESIRAEIRIFAPNGSRIEDIRIGWGRGAFGWTWDGLTDAGAVRKPGAYRVVLELHDRASNEARARGEIQLLHGVPAT